MNKIFYSIMLIITVLFYTPTAQAIIFLPAIILIPIAKIVAIIIGAFSIPSFGLGALITKLFGKSLKKTISLIFLLLIIAGIFLGIFLKLHNPNRPWF